MNKDHIAGLLSLQLGFVTPSELKAIADHEGPEVQESDLVDMLMARGVLTPERASAIGSLATEIIRANNGNAEDAFRNLGGAQGHVHTLMVKQTLASEDYLSSEAEMDTIAHQDGASFSHSEDAVAVTEEQPGRYTFKDGDPIRAEIGRGGIGRVLLMHDEHLGRDVAVKELLPGIASATGSIDLAPTRMSATVDAVVRFLREARVTGQLEHPGIVPVYELGRRLDGALYYSMRLVRGQNLAECLGQCKSLDDRLKYLGHYVDVCQAIAYAHSRGVIHRDIKPLNVMVGEFGETVVLDWGLAKVRGKKDLRGREIQREIRVIQDANSGETMVGVAMGTPAYMSPEQAVGLVDEIDEKSDVWSLGAVLYEILTGNPPFKGKGAHDILARVATRPVRSPREINDQIPPDLASVCEKALLREKKDRYESAMELAGEIEAYQAGQRVQAYEYNSWELFKRLVVRNRAISSLVLALAVILVVGSVVIFGAYQTAEVSRRRAVEQTGVAEAARGAETAARMVAEREEKEAHHNLSIALREEAARKAETREYLSARVFTAAALLHTPYNPHSRHRYQETMVPDVGTAAEELAALQSHLFLAEVEKIATLDKVLIGHDRTVMSVRTASQGSRAYSVGVDGTLREWDLRSGQERWQLKAHSSSLIGLALAPGDQQAAAWGDDGDVALWDLNQRKITRSFTTGGVRINYGAFSPDGSLLVGGSFDARVFVWDVKSGRTEAILEGHTDNLRADVVFSPDGTLMATGSVDRTIRLWDVARRKTIAVLEGHEDAIYSLAFSHSGKLLASAGHDGTVRLWDIQSPSQEAILSDQEGHAISLAFSPDDALLASGTHDGYVRLWAVAPGELAQSLKAHDSYVRAVDFTPDGELLATAGNDGRIRLWRLDRPAAVRIRTNHEKSIYRVAFSPDGRTLAAGSLDGGISLWRASDGTLAGYLDGHSRLIWSLDFAPDGKSLVSTSPGDGATVWDLENLAAKVSMRLPDLQVSGARFSQDGASLLIICGGSAGVWNAATGQNISTFDVKPGRFAGPPALSTDGKTTAVPAADFSVALFSFPGLKPMRVLTGHTDIVSWAEFSPDGKTLLTASKDSTIRLWNAASGEALRTIKGHGDWVNTARYSSDAQVILSGSDDNTLRISSALDGRVLQIQNLGHEMTGLAFNPAGDRFAVADETSVSIFPLGTDLWKRDPEILLEEVQREAGRRIDGFRLVALQ